MVVIIILLDCCKHSIPKNVTVMKDCTLLCCQQPVPPTSARQEVFVDSSSIAATTPY